MYMFNVVAFYLALLLYPHAQCNFVVAINIKCMVMIGPATTNHERNAIDAI